MPVPFIVKPPLVAPTKAPLMVVLPVPATLRPNAALVILPLTVSRLDELLTQMLAAPRTTGALMVAGPTPAARLIWLSIVSVSVAGRLPLGAIV